MQENGWYSPSGIANDGGGHPGSDRMARLNKAQRNLKTTARLTPRDVEVAGTFAQPRKAPKEPPRKPTYNETKGNNEASVKTFRYLWTLHLWVPLFVEDLERMNAGKIGRPFEFSDAQILWMNTVLAGLDSDYRKIAGMMQGVLQYFGLKAPSYTRFQERSVEVAARLLKKPDGDLLKRYGESIYFLHVNGNVTGNVRRVGLDSTGMSLSSANRWRQRKWHGGTKDRGWLKIHALCDVDSGEVIACAVTDESVGDAPLLKVLVGEALARGHRIGTVYGDNAYCTDENWAYLCNEKRLEFVTSFKVTTSPTCNGCFKRGEAAQLWCSLPYDEWVKVSGYGTRWKCEVVFSSFKTIFTEMLTARSRDGLIRQTASNLEYFNLYKRIRAQIIGVTGNGVVIG